MAFPRTRATIAFAIAALVMLAMTFSNSDWGGDPDSARGDGTYRPVLARGDGHLMYLITQSLVLDGDLHYDNNLAQFGDPWSQPKTKTGRTMIPQPIGPSLIQAPLFVVAHATSKIANLFGANIASHGYTMTRKRSQAKDLANTEVSPNKQGSG